MNQNTSIVFQQPQPVIVGIPSTNTCDNTSPITRNSSIQYDLKDWDSGLCGCMADCQGCLYCTFCFCCFSCSLAAKMKECFLGPIFLGWPFYTALRTKMRGDRKIKGSILEDVLCIVCCTPCAAHQMYREIECAR